MKKALICLFFTIIMALTLPGCEGEEFATNAYKTLKSADITYVATMEAVAAAQAKNIITANQREVINSKAHLYVDAFRAAASALYSWQLSKAAEDKMAVMQNVSSCVKTVKELVSSAANYGVNVKEAEAAK